MFNYKSSFADFRKPDARSQQEGPEPSIQKGPKERNPTLQGVNRNKIGYDASNNLFEKQLKALY